MSVVYAAAFLPEESRATLLAAFPPKHPKVLAHHVTLAFKPSKAELEILPMGQLIKLRVVGYAADGFGQAVVVEPQGAISKNAIPHITISVDKKSPVYSNEMLSKGHESIIPFEIYARVGVFTDSGQTLYDIQE
jgi:hypothetical protein